MSELAKRAIPSSGERVPVVGLGTWQTFDVSSPEEKISLKKVLAGLVSSGGSVVDSSPMYGRSEKVLGELSTELDVNQKLFIASKVWTTGRENGLRQMKNSMALLKRQQLDLMQVHNLSDWQTHLPTLHEWKDQKLVRYIGITHYTESAYPQVEQVLRSEKLDFLQINYSLLSRQAEERIFPLATEKKVAVIINRPFEEGNLFRRVKGKTLPDWAREFDCSSWAQFFLKFILAHSSVTCVIPGTSKPEHLLDNLGAGKGRLPDQEHIKKMIRLIGQ